MKYQKKLSAWIPSNIDGVCHLEDPPLVILSHKSIELMQASHQTEFMLYLDVIFTWIDALSVVVRLGRSSSPVYCEPFLTTKNWLLACRIIWR